VKHFGFVADITISSLEFEGHVLDHCTSSPKTSPTGAQRLGLAGWGNARYRRHYDLHATEDFHFTTELLTIQFWRYTNADQKKNTIQSRVNTIRPAIYGFHNIKIWQEAMVRPAGCLLSARPFAPLQCTVGYLRLSHSAPWPYSVVWTLTTKIQPCGTTLPLRKLQQFARINNK
jgi:hypothetical protein